MPKPNRLVRVSQKEPAISLTTKRTNEGTSKMARFKLIVAHWACSRPSAVGSTDQIIKPLVERASYYLLTKLRMNEAKERSFGSIFNALVLGRTSASFSVLPKVFVLLLILAQALVPGTSLPSVQAAAGINEQLNFQARLLTAAGGLVDDGNYHVRFRIYSGGDGDLGGGDETLEWTETHTTGNLVTVSNGYLSAQLGSITAFGTDVDWNEDTLWLSIDIGGNGGSASWDGEMDPFMRLSAVPYAFNAENLGGRGADEFVQLDPSSEQAVNTANTLIQVDQAGAGDLIDLQVSNSTVFSVSNGGNGTFSGDLAVNGGDLTTTQTTFNLFNSTVTTANLLGAATTIEIGASTGTTSINNSLTVDGNVTLGTAAGDTLTILGDDTDITFSDSAFTTCTALETVSGVLKCGTDDSGGSTPTLQDAYDNDASGDADIITATNKDILFSLANTATDSNFNIEIADDSTSTVSISRLDGTGTNNPAQLLLLTNLDTNQGIADGLLVQASGGGLTDAIDVSGSNITNAINVGANTIFGTGGAVINFDNFDVSSAGAVTALSYGGITESNLLDKSATETISGSYTFTTDVNLTFAGTENLAVTSDLAGSVDVLSVIATPSSTAGTTRGLVLQQADSANTNGLDTGLLIDNADTNLAIVNGIQLTNSGGGGYTTILDTPSLDITGSGAITGATGISSSGTITFSGLTASRAVFTDGSSNLTSTAASAALLSSLSDETGTGVAVFGTSPNITTSLTTGSSTFSLVNTNATTLNLGGAATTLSIGAATGTTTVNNLLNVSGASSGVGLTVSNSTSTDEIAIFQDNGTAVFTIDNGGSAVLAAVSDSTAVFDVQDAADQSYLTVDTSNLAVEIGNGTDDVLLVVDSFTTDPGSAADGAIFYDSDDDVFRCRVNGAWVNCDTTGGGGSSTIKLQFSPEFAGGTLSADGSNNNVRISSGWVNALSSSEGEKHIYYSVDTNQASAQDYDFVVQVPIPSDFSSIGAASTFKFWHEDPDGATTNANVTWELYDEDETQCFSTTFEGTTAGVWEQESASSLGSCSISANDIITFIFKVKTTSGAGAINLGEFEFEYDT